MWLERVTRELRKYDDQLYADLSSDGVPCVFRKKAALESYEFEGCVISKVINRPDLVFSLTDTWLIHGTPVRWGIEPILAKLRACDQNNRDIFKEMNEHNDRVDASKKRDFSNKLQAWAHDYRHVFAKETNHINTALIKSDLEFEKRKENKLWQS